jgi:hypothetical protein
MPSPRPTPRPALSPLFEGDDVVVGDGLAEVGRGEAGGVADEVEEGVVAAAVEEEAAFCEMLK